MICGQSLEDRCELTRILLRTRLDYLTQPKGMNLGAVPGATYTGYKRCPDCMINIRWNGHCGACNGTRQIRVQLPPEKPNATLKKTTKPTVLLAQSQGGEDVIDRQLRLRDSRNARGSYQELERNLELMPTHLRDVIRVVYDCGLTARHWAEPHAVLWLCKRMRGPIRVSPRDFEPIKQRRIIEARRLEQLGKSNEEISLLLGVGLRFLRRVLSGTSARIPKSEVVV